MTTTSARPIRAGITAAVRDLFWHEFFASRGRGISLDVHCPWLADAAGVHGLWLADERAPGGVAAALVIREREISPQTRIGLVGLVCVHEPLRGQGLSAVLLAEALRQARALGLSDLILWTAKPAVYACAGFVEDVREISLSVQTPKDPPPLRAAPTRRPLACALPAFATHAWAWQADGARLTTLDGPWGVTLADWQGEPDALIALLGHAMPAQWRVNGAPDEPLFADLTRHGFAMQTLAGTWRMRAHTGAGPAIAVPSISLLERI